MPVRAAARLERLLVNLDLPLEGVALCRLELGLCRLAAGDTRTNTWSLNHRRHLDDALLLDAWVAHRHEKRAAGTDA